MPWTIPVPMLPEESISSWLTRAALAQGCDPLVLTGAVWRGWRAWTVDVDRGIPAGHLPALSNASGLPKAVFEMSALRRDAELVAGRTLPAAAAWPWILALGSRNRARRAGQQYCPECLAQDVKPYFRRRWRFAWNTGCLLHGVMLRDRCQACGAPVQPHRLVAEDRVLRLCARCKADLSEAGRFPLSSGAEAFQRKADEALGNGEGGFGGERISASDWFAAAHFLVGVIRLACRKDASRMADAIRSLGIRVDGGMLLPTGLPLELLSASERQALFEALNRMLEFGPADLARAFKEFGVAASALHDGRGPLPSPVVELLSALPRGKRGPIKGRQTTRRGPRSKRAVMAAWVRLRRKMLAGEA